MANALQRLESRYEAAMLYLPQKASNFRLEVTDLNPPRGVSMQKVQEFLRVYAPTVEPSNFVSIGNEYSPVGGLQLASVAPRENMGFAVSCYDTKKGLIRKWLEAKALQMVALDGTFGVPAQYCLVLKLLSDADEKDDEKDDEKGSVFSVQRVVKLESVNYSHDVNGDLLMLSVQLAEFDSFVSAEVLRAK